MFLLSSVLCPVLWYLWIHAGSANANFFFAMTLTYALAQVHLLATWMVLDTGFFLEICRRGGRSIDKHTLDLTNVCA